jgi:hypothetical protein
MKGERRKEREKAVRKEGRKKECERGTKGIWEK